MIFCPSSNTGTSGTGSIDGGVVELCPSPLHVAKYYKEIILNGNLVIPPQKPPKEHIVKVTHQIILKDVEVLTVTLPDGTVAGNKIIVAGIVSLSVQYVADVPDQKVHHVHYDLPFTGIILADCGELIPTADPIFPNNFVVHICVEKVRLTQIDNRTLSKEIVLMLWVEQKQ